MDELDRRSALACLSAIEVNMAECRGIGSWWKLLSVGCRQEWVDHAAMVRMFQHELQGMAPGPEKPSSPG
jgi:hypothetical protein